MTDLSIFASLREGNSLEAKLARGGLPKSIWETYSAFANTSGGAILLGVREHKDHSLEPVGVPNPEELVQEFWNLVSNPQKASVNLLSSKDVTVESIDTPGGPVSIVVIRVAPAPRQLRPVFVDGNPLSGTYRRNGEGDYRCTKDEYEAMVRDAGKGPLLDRAVPDAEL